MPAPDDAALLSALESQVHRLGAVLHRLEVAKRDLVPGPAGFWRGSARAAYDTAVETIGTTVDAGLAAVRSAHDRTAAAIAEVVGRG